MRCCIHSSGGFFHDSSSFKRFFLGSCCFVCCVGVHEFCYSRCLSLCLRADPNSSLWFVCSNLSCFFLARYLSSSITLRRSLVLSCLLSFFRPPPPPHSPPLGRSFSQPITNAFETGCSRELPFRNCTKSSALGSLSRRCLWTVSSSSSSTSESVVAVLGGSCSWLDRPRV